ncbi:MAG: hypothetical protein ACQEXJ_00180 [Myxococcota bacterium]
MEPTTNERVRASLTRDGWGGVGVRALDGCGVATLTCALPDTEEARQALERAWAAEGEAERVTGVPG